MNREKPGSFFFHPSQASTIPRYPPSLTWILDSRLVTHLLFQDISHLKSFEQLGFRIQPTSACGIKAIWSPRNSAAARAFAGAKRLHLPVGNLQQKSLDERNHKGVNPKIEGKPPKMDGENHGKPYEQMGWFGGFQIFPYFWKPP